MLNYRYRRCFCMNNMPHTCSQNSLETSCNNTYKSECFNENCNCGFDEEINVFPNYPKLGQSYVPYQFMDETFKPCVGLTHGTIFPELVSPYSPGDSMRDIEYIEKTNTIGKGCNSCQ